MQVLSTISLKPYTTFEIGGPAQHLLRVRTERDITEALEWAKERALSVTLLAGGSNVLVADGGVSGAVLHVVGGSWRNHDDLVEVDAGASLYACLQTLATEGKGGVEALAGIPGTVGGAVRGNAGAFGAEIQEVIHRVRALHIDTGEVRVFTPAACEFSYRSSYFKTHPEWIITSALCAFSAIRPEEAARRMRETLQERERRHIQDVRAAGSYFMNPEAPASVQKHFEKEKGVPSRAGRVPAGWLIEKAGMKGESEGGARSSPLHADYLVNETGNASARDVAKLAQRIKAAVQREFGITLREEVQLLGRVST